MLFDSNGRIVIKRVSSLMNYLESSAWSSGEDKKRDNASAKNKDKEKQATKSTKNSK